LVGPRTREKRVAALLGVLAALALLGVAEVAVRIGWDEPLDPYPVGFGGQRPSGPVAPLLEYDPSLFWRQRADAERTLAIGSGETYTIRTNSLGLRDDPFPAPGQGPRVSGLLLGDSNTWGEGVDNHETYTNVLESMLAANLPGLQVDLLNAGVPAYSTTQSLRLERQLLEAYSFDLVGIYNMGPDMMFTIRPDSAYEKGPFAALASRVLVRSAVIRLLRRSAYSEEDEVLFNYYRPDSPHRVPAEPDYRRQLQAMVEEAQLDGARVLLIVPLPMCLEQGECLVTPPNVEQQRVSAAVNALRESEQVYREVMRGVADDTGALLVDLPAWLETRADPTALYLDMTHPTVEGHRLIAGELLAAIQPLEEIWRASAGAADGGAPASR